MVESASYDPIVVEPDITDEKIRELLNRRKESAKLDYKSRLNVSDTRSKVQLAKHIMAMANTVGGYILVGVNDDGSLANLTKSDVTRLDEATIRAQLQSYCGLPLPISVDNAREVDGAAVAVITVLPLPDAIAVASRAGDYPDGQAFRSGEVLVRHGSASESWTQRDAEFILKRIVRSRKSEWLGEFAADYRRVEELKSGGRLPTIDRSVLELPSDQFKDVVIKLMRQ